MYSIIKQFMGIIALSLIVLPMTATAAVREGPGFQLESEALTAAGGWNSSGMKVFSSFGQSHQTGDTTGKKPVIPSDGDFTLYPGFLTPDTVSVCNPGDVSGDGAVSAYDAALVLQYVVGIINKFPVEMMGILVCNPGDVSGNGTVSAYDAALILQYVVKIIDKFPYELMGTPIATQRPESYKVSIPSLTVALENRISVPIIIDDATGITAGGIVVKYDAETLRAVNVSTSEILSGYYWMKSINPGEVRIAFAGTIPLHGKGELLYIEFESLPSAGKSQSPIILAEVNFGERVQVIKAHGSVEVLPTETALLANYPNPFNPDTWIPFLLAEPAEVTITIFSVTGQVVRTMALGYRGAGIYIRKDKAAYWNGKNKNGETVGSGVYFYTLNAGKFTATRKMLVIK